MTIQWTPTNKPALEYKSTKDGKTYCVRQLTGTENGKSITGMYVYDKSAKPDMLGNIQGEFMSFPTFMEKVANELPTINADLAKQYNPNIQTMSAEEKFDKDFNSGVPLSDDKILLRPHIIFTGSHQIARNQDGTYTITTKSFLPQYRNNPPTVKTLTEDELYNDKGLCGGSIKKLDDNSYEVTYYTSSNYKEHEMTTEVMDKKTCIDFLKTHCLYI